MDRSNLPAIKKFVLKIIMAYADPEVAPSEGINHSSNLFDVGIDSIDIIEIVGVLNQEYGVIISPHVLFECRTVDSIASYIHAWR